MLLCDSPLVPYGDLVLLRAAIEYLLANPERAREMGERARSAGAWFTTEGCNTAIWNHTLDLVHERAHTVRIPVEWS